MTEVSNIQVQQLRAFVDSKKRAVQEAERAYDTKRAVQALEELVSPLSHSSAYDASWKQLYLDHFYRDISKFVLSFVCAHILPGLSDAQRSCAVDAFFDRHHVPTQYALNALVAHITATKLESSTTTAEDEAVYRVSNCVRLLERVLDDDGLASVVQHLITQYDDPKTHTRVLMSAQPMVSSLCSLPDLVFNRLQRRTPSWLTPRMFFKRLCDQLLDAALSPSAHDHDLLPTDAHTTVFRLFADKLARVGHFDDLLAAWLSRRDLYEPGRSAVHTKLLGSLPPGAWEPLLTYASNLRSTDVVNGTASAPQYRLISLIPTELMSNKQFQHTVAHKLVLKKHIKDPLITRALIEAMTHPNNAEQSPLEDVFDTVVNRWSGPDFASTADYGLNDSICFFLRFAMTQIRRDVFAGKPWTMKLCRGVQHHMGHSVERVRLLGMRVGESVSKIMSPENPLDFEIAEPDQLDTISAVQFDFTPPTTMSDSQGRIEASAGDVVKLSQVDQVKAKAKKKGLGGLDLDAVVDSDDDQDEDDASEVSDSESDISLEAYDMNDDEQDLKAPRPLYIKDLLAGLHAEDDRDKTETALAEAESLLRRMPKDLHFNAKAVVTALLRLEDKYNTPNFVLLRAKALAAACALSPTHAIPYLQTQALEWEQLLQSRLDVLQAMAAAAYELSETGAFRPSTAKNLLHEDLDTRTTQGLKTRRFGYRRDPLVPAKKNAFGDHALSFFTPLLFGYVEYARKMAGSKRVGEVEDVFLAHLLHALSVFVECAGHAPVAVPMAKSLLEFAWHHRTNTAAAVRRQVLYSFSRVLLVMPPFMLRQELGQSVIDMLVWLQETNKSDPDEGCRDASRLLLSSGAVPMLTMP